MKSVCLCLVAAALACGKKTEPAPAAPSPAAPSPSPSEPPASEVAVGTLTGKITFDGAPPEMPELDRFAASGKPRDPACATQEKASWVVVNGGGVKDTVVRVAVGALKGRPGAGHGAVIDQKNCLYTPHVVGLVVGQQLGIKNSDDTLHNVHTYAGDEGDRNEAFPAGMTAVRWNDVNIPAGDVDYRVKCDVHPWMEAHVLVSDNAFFTVTGDDGSFKLFAPVGKYTLQAWHPHLGSKTIEVTVEAGKTAEVKFPAFSAADFKRPS